MNANDFPSFFVWWQIFEVFHTRRKVGAMDGIEFVIHTDEHNPPHLHAAYEGKEIVLEIPSGRVLRGNLRPDKARKAGQWVKDHSELLERMWNELTGGFRLPVR